MRDSRMEYEANLFAAQISLSDEDSLELAERGYDTQQIARTLNSDINLGRSKIRYADLSRLPFAPAGAL